METAHCLDCGAILDDEETTHCETCQRIFESEWESRYSGGHRRGA